MSRWEFACSPGAIGFFAQFECRFASGHYLASAGSQQIAARVNFMAFSPFSSRCSAPLILGTLNNSVFQGRHRGEKVFVLFSHFRHDFGEFLG